MTRTSAGRVIVVTTLLAIGAIAVATLGWLAPDADRAAATPTTDSTTSSEPATSDRPESTTGTVNTMTDPEVAVDGRPTGYIPGRLPDGFVPAGVSVSQGDADQSAGSWLQVWASPGAARTAGRWLAVSTSSYEWVPFDSAAPDVERVLVGDRYALQRTSDDGVRTLSFTSGDQSANMVSFGFSDDEVGEIVRDLLIGGGDARPEFAQSAHLLDGLDLLVSRSAEVSVDGPLLNTKQSASYTSPDGISTLSVGSGPQSPNDLVVSRLLAAPPADLAVSDAVNASEFGADNTAAAVGTYGSRPYRTRFVMWHDGVSTVTLSASEEIPFTDLLAIAASVHVSTADEWQTLMQPQPTVNNPNSGEVSLPSSFTTVGEITAASQTVWTVGVGVRAALMPPAPGTVWVQVEARRPPDDDSFGSTGSNLFPFSFTSDQAESVATYRFIDATIVVATVDRANGASSAVALRVRLPGLEPVDVPLVPVMNSTISGAAYAFSQVGDYSAELIDAGGNVVTPPTPS